MSHDKTQPAKKLVITKAQILHVLTVFVLTPLAGFVAAWVPKHFPGLPRFTSGEITAMFITGAGAALTAGIHYLHGLQVWERTAGRYIAVETPKPLEGHLVQATPPQANVILHVHGAGGVNVKADRPVETTGEAAGADAAAPEQQQTPQATTSPATPTSQSITGV